MKQKIYLSDKEGDINQWLEEEVGSINNGRRGIGSITAKEDEEYEKEKKELILSIFDRDDLSALYQLVIDKYQDEIPKGFDLILWGDLTTMFHPNKEDDFWKSQEKWNIMSWKLHKSTGVHTLKTDMKCDFPPLARNKETQVLEVVPFEEQYDDLKKKLAKNNKAKMVLCNALPKKEYEIIFMCKTAKEIWQSLLITHQGNSQVKDIKIDLLVQQYEQFSILEEEESIDSGVARFNSIIMSLKALDEGFSS
ncbi:hypothetical protein Tco_1001728 [Tanacetum coccineum]